MRAIHCRVKKKNRKSASLPTPMRVSSYTFCVQLSDFEYINKRPLCARQLSQRSGYNNNISRCFVTFSTYCQIYLSIQNLLLVKSKLIPRMEGIKETSQVEMITLGTDTLRLFFTNLTGRKVKFTTTHYYAPNDTLVIPMGVSSICY